jgi:hypothetical protein
MPGSWPMKRHAGLGIALVLLDGLFEFVDFLL